jgi:hypothetical protein
MSVGVLLLTARTKTCHFTLFDGTIVSGCEAMVPPLVMMTSAEEVEEAL